MSLQLVPNHSKCLPSLLVFTSLLRITFMVLQKPCQGNFGKLEGFGEGRFGGSKKDCYILKIPEWLHKPFWDYKPGKLVSYFLNNAAKRCFYWLKISENIEIEHVFQSKSFFISTQATSAPLESNYRGCSVLKSHLNKVSGPKT